MAWGVPIYVLAIAERVVANRMRGKLKELGAEIAVVRCFAMVKVKLSSCLARYGYDL
jgi:hypothetical protein